jgi:hypothetical protein
MDNRFLDKHYSEDDATSAAECWHAWKDGYSAFVEKKDINTNPFVMELNPIQFRGWQCGWYCALAKFMEAEHNQ